MADAPTCLACKNCRVGFLAIFRDNPKCAVVTERNVVTGDLKQQFCSIARWEGEPCGPAGKLFEPR